MHVDGRDWPIGGNNGGSTARGSAAGTRHHAIALPLRSRVQSPKPPKPDCLQEPGKPHPPPGSCDASRPD